MKSLRFELINKKKNKKEKGDPFCLFLDFF